MTAGPDSDDLPALFAAAPAALLVLRPDPPAFTIVTATDAYLGATLQTRATLVGHPVFDALPDANPGNPAPTGVANLRASLETVLRRGAPHAMPVQRYDLRRPDGTWKERGPRTASTPTRRTVARRATCGVTTCAPRGARCRSRHGPCLPPGSTGTRRVGTLPPARAASERGGR